MASVLEIDPTAPLGKSYQTSHEPPVALEVEATSRYPLLVPTPMSDDHQSPTCFCQSLVVKEVLAEKYPDTLLHNYHYTHHRGRYAMVEEVVGAGWLETLAGVAAVAVEEVLIAMRG